MEQAASVAAAAAAAATAVVAVGADKDARNSTTKRKSSFGNSDSSPAAAVKRPTKITDFWKPPVVTTAAVTNGASDEQDKLLNQKTVSKSPCSDRTNTDASSNHAIKTAKDAGKELNECRGAPASPTGTSEKRIRNAETASGDSQDRNMHVESNDTNGNNDDDDVVVVSESSAKSPRKSQRNTPAKSYKEYDKNLYEDKKSSKPKNRSYEKFREFFKNTAERLKEPKIMEKKSPKRIQDGNVSVNGFKKRLSTDSSSSTTPKRRGRPPRSEEEREARKLEYKKKISEKLKEKRKLEREAKQKERILDDDLSLSNLIYLPTFTEIECSIPKEGLGEFFCILEFMTAFSKELSVKDYFSQGISFDILERAFTENDALGLLVNVFQILLSKLVKLQLSDWTVDYNTQNEGDDLYTKMAVFQEQAAAAGREFRDTYGFMFHSVPLDSFTYSDVVRYHLKASGAPGIDLRDRIHCHQGFTPKEDPGLIFVMRNPEIMEKLETNSVASLDVLEKMKIVRCLIDQLLTFELFRDTIEDGLEKCVELKIQLKKLLWRKKLLDDEEKGIKRDKDEEAAAAVAAAAAAGNEDEKKRRNWRYVLPEMPRDELEKRIEQTEDEIGRVWYRFGLSSLGEDRAHRIYSVLHSVPAIVVEVMSCVESPCIEGGTPESEVDGTQDVEMKEDTGEDAEALPMDSHLICSGSIESCAIHREKESQYLFISSQEQLDSLLKSLATKGVRESVLRETIVNELEYLKTVVKKTPISKLNRTLNEAVRRKYPSEAFKVSNVFGLRANLALNLTFRELLLDIEEKSIQASLGGFRDDERRRSWRAELEKPLLKIQDLKPELSNQLYPESGDAAELQFLIPKLSEFCETIPVKFLKAPLGDQGPSLRNKLDNWRAALPDCRNFSQLFLFYSSLESSIEWQKGLTNARCKVCRGKATPERMIRCETCDLVFHLPCIKPALREIPQGEWFCKSCSPEVAPDSPKKKLKVTKTEDEEDSVVEVPESNDYCEVCLNDEQLISCGSCPRSFHLICIQMKRAPRRDWRCRACTAGVKKYKQELKELKKLIEEKEAFETKDNNDDDFINQCLKCGELLSRGHIECVGCGRKYHLACADLTKRPKGDWYCKKRCEPGYVSLNQTLNDESDEEESEDEEPEVEMKQEEVDVDGFDYKACCDILDVLKRSDHAWPFLVPVSKKDAPDYLKIIKKPMDIGTIQSKLNDMKYTTNKAFVNDVLQVFINCEAYNLEEADVYKEGKRLLEIFMGLLDNYSMSSLLNPQEFRWLEEVIRSKCTKCRMDFPYGIKKVCCRLCYTTLHLKCAGLRISVEKWLCPACVGKEPEPEEGAEEDNHLDMGDEKNLANEFDLNNMKVEVDGFDYKGCTELLNSLIKDDLSFPFRRPVTKKEAPDYFDVIENPMDLSTIQSSLNNMGYKHNMELIDDVLLMFRNCERYNDERSNIYAGAMQFWKATLKKITDIGFGSLVDPAKVPKWNPPKNSRRSNH